MDITDNEIIAEIIEGQEQAVSRFFEKYKKLIYSQAFRIVQNKEDAFDIVHDCFIKFLDLLEKKKIFTDNIPALLRKISLNMALDMVRARKRQNLIKKVPFVQFFWNKNMEEPWQKIARIELHNELTQLIFQLSSMQQKIIFLRYFEGLKIIEIAEICECTTGAVKKNLNRAQLKLRTLMKNKKSEDYFDSDTFMEFKNVRLLENELE